MGLVLAVVAFGTVLVAGRAEAAVPTNDGFASAILLTGSNATVSGSNVDATLEPGEPQPESYGGLTRSVWWEWTAPASGLWTVDLAGSDFDTMLGIYTGSSVDALTKVASNDEQGDNHVSKVADLAVTAGVTYRVQIGGWAQCSSGAGNGCEGTIALAATFMLPPTLSNDSFATASALSGSAATASGSNVDATLEPGEPQPESYGGLTRSVWWEWTAPASGSWTVDLAGSDFNTMLGIYTGSSVDALTKIASNDDQGSNNQVSKVADLAVTAGVTYRIQIGGYATGGLCTAGAGVTCEGTIALAATFVRPAPSNDSFATASALGGSAATVSGSNVLATLESGEPQPEASGGMTRSVWWKWTAPASGLWTVDLAGSDFDTMLGVYTGSSVDALTKVASNNDQGTDHVSKVADLAVTAGETYRIQIGGYTPDGVCTPGAGVGCEGTIGLTAKLVALPGNDAFGAAAVLTGSAATVSGSNVLATLESGEPQPEASGGMTRSVWWEWTAPASGLWTVDLAGSDFDTMLGVYTGSSVDALTKVASNNDQGTDRVSKVADLAVTAGETYWIQIGGYATGGVCTPGPGNGCEGTIALAATLVRPVPSNDAFGAAAVLTGSNATVSGSNVDATLEPGEPQPESYGGLTRSVWWEWTAPASGLWTVDLAGSDFDTMLGIYTGSSVDALTKVASNDDQGSNYQVSKVADLAVTAGETYWIQIGGYATGGVCTAGAGVRCEGTIALAATFVRPAPSNDSFATASALGGSAATVSGSNVLATLESGEPQPEASGGMTRSVWWEWTAPASGLWTVDLVGSDFDTMLGVYTGSSVDALTKVASNNDQGSNKVSKVADLAVTAGETYWIQIGGYTPDGVCTPGPGNGCEGTIALAATLVRPAPTNDAFGAAAVLTGANATASGWNVAATLESGEPQPEASGGMTRSVWWEWTAPASGSWTVDLAGSDFDTMLGIYTGSSVDALTKVASNDDQGSSYVSKVANLAVTAGVTYRIQIGGYAIGGVCTPGPGNGCEGTIALAATFVLPPAPSNDSFTTASALGGSNATVSGSNVQATLESGEPQPEASGGMTRSVWWEWTAPASGLWTVDLAGSDFDTMLGVYTGSSVDALTKVASNNDQGTDRVSKVADLAVTAGETYWIQIGGYTPDGVCTPGAGVGCEGTIALAATLVRPVPSNDAFGAAAVLTGSNATVSGWNVQATLEPGEPQPESYGGLTRSVWWEWTAPASGSWTVDLAGSDFDTMLGIYTGSSVDALTKVASNDEHDGNHVSKVVNLAVTAGVTYRIQIGGWAACVSGAGNGCEGTIALAATFVLPPAPSNDSFTTASALSGSAATVSGSNVQATLESGEPQPEASAGMTRSVWWEWTAPASGSWTVDLAGSDFDTMLGVYTGSSVDALTKVASNNDQGTDRVSKVADLAVTAGETYWIQIGGYTPDGVCTPGAGVGCEGTIALAATLVRPAPTNDAFGAAAVLTGANATASGWNVAATLESGEPQPEASGGMTRSVWWEWTAPASGSWTVDLAGSDFDTMLGIYTGSSVDALTKVASNDQQGSNHVSKVSDLAVTAGVTYRIQIGGWAACVSGAGNGCEGTIALAATLVTATPGAPTVGAVVAGDGEVSVSWTAPGDEGASPVTGYVVRPFVGSVAEPDRVFDSTATTEVVTGLTNGSAYTFKVAAINAAGTGAFSDASDPVTPSGGSAVGMLRVVTDPPVASQISIDGHEADTWGLTWVKVPVGDHDICFRPVAGYEPVPCQTVTIEADVTTSAVATFVARGWLRVTTSPAVGSQISVDGVPRNNWGLWTDLSVGAHEVCFGAVADHAPPPCQTVQVAADGVTEVTGTFTDSPGAPGLAGVGYLRATTSPATPSQISIDGVPANTWGLDWVEVAPGTHQVCFRAVEGFSGPPCETVTVTDGATETITGTFTERGFLRVITDPAVPATITVDGIPVNDWVNDTDRPAGTYHVCFGDVPGKTAPACQDPVVNPGTLTTITGAYT